jgi:hypothetical protein
MLQALLTSPADELRRHRIAKRIDRQARGLRSLRPRLSVPRELRRQASYDLRTMSQALRSRLIDLARVPTEKQIEELRQDMCRAGIRVALGYESQSEDIHRPVVVPDRHYRGEAWLRPTLNLLRDAVSASPLQVAALTGMFTLVALYLRG